MENKVPTSVRLEPEIIRAAEKAIAGRPYYKKSDFINNVLMAVIHNFGERQIYDMIRWTRWSHRKVECEFRETDEDLPYNEYMERRKMWEKK